MPENIYDQDRFYVDLETDRVIWMYHNPDAVSGDQFVCNIFDKDLLKEAIRECPIGPDSGFEPTPVFDYLAENCRQYLSDVGEIAYDANKERFESDPVCIGMTHGTLETLQLLYDARQMITGAVAAYGEAFLTKAADPSTQASAVQIKKPFQFSAVNGFFSSGMIFSEIVANLFFIIHSIPPYRSWSLALCFTGGSSIP